jgi:hypothetical protein
MSEVNQTALYNQGVSNAILDSLNLIHDQNPSHNPEKPTNEKLTPMGKSPENVEASQVKSINQELAGNSSLETQRAR